MPQSITVRAAVAATLCVVLLEQPLLAAAPVAKKPVAPAQIAGQQRVLHALNRFTFGPRPGDVAAVERMGVDRWFEAQLNPQTIDDSALEARLAEYPAMRLTIDQLSARYPAQQTIRAYESGKLALPSDPVEHALVVDQIALDRMQKAKKAAAAQTTAGEAAGPMLAGASEGMEMSAAAGPSTLTREQALAVVALPPDQRIAAILALPPADLVRFRQIVRGPEAQRLIENLSPAQKELLTALQGAGRMVALEATESRMLRDLYSERQLEAVMTDFWLNHFNVYMKKNQQEPYLIPAYERETIRPNALGNFETLLVAVAKSPAMQVYLDNFKSVGPDSKAATRVKRLQQLRPNGKIVNAASAGLNENYGRELMELHTVGVNGAGYTQTDVTNVAKVFTGWGVARPRPATGDAIGMIAGQPAARGPEPAQALAAGDGVTFEFNENRHEPGSKVVLGVTIREAGEQEGLEVLHMLATSPATAHYISQKLAVRFVSDTPPPALVDRMAASFTASHGDIKTVLRTMFRSPEFWSPEVYRAKVKTPEEFLISAVRASDAEVRNPAPLVQALDRLGQPFYGMQTPNGYSWTQEGWVGTGQLVNRMNFALVLSGGRIPGTRTAWSRLIDGQTMPAQMTPAAYTGNETTTQKESRLEQVLLGQAVSDRTRATVLGESNDVTVTAQAETQFDLRAQAGDKNAVRTRGLLDARDAASPPDDPQAAVMAGLLLGSPEFQRR